MPSKIIGKLIMDNGSLQKDLDAIAEFPVLEEAYPEFGFGSWTNHSLWNKTGDFNEMHVQDSSSPAKITELGKKVPYLAKIILETFDVTHLRMVRSRNLVDGIVFPHKDFVELSQNKNHYLRVFIPLETNQNAYHSDEYSVFQMQKNEIWHLDASIIHSAANFSTDSRINICLDFQFTEAIPPLESIFLDQNTTTNLAEPTIPTEKKFEDLDIKLNKLAQRINKDNFFEILVDLSKIHFHYDVSISDCYDWMIIAAEKSGSDDLLKKCKKLKKFMIGERALGEQFSFMESLISELLISKGVYRNY